VLPLVFLGLGLVCALISRILLLIAAVRISVGWALGVFLPFGPMFFRLNYPEEAKPSMLFRFATLPCLGAYLVMGPGPSLSSLKRDHSEAAAPSLSSKLVHYAIEKPASAKKVPSAPTPQPTPSLDERRVANAKELERLRKEAESLRLRKRDLLHSDTEGNRIYVVDLALYNDALAKATAERNALATAVK